MRFDEPSTAKNVAGAPPTKRTVDAEGRVITEKVCPIPCSIKMVDPSGFVVTVPLANGSGQRMGPANPYGAQVMAAKIAKGWIPYSVCPVAAGHIKPRDAKDKPCAGSDGAGKFSADGCCPHVEQVIRVRRDDYEAKQRDYAATFRSNQERMLELLEKDLERRAGEIESKDGKKVF